MTADAARRGLMLACALAAALLCACGSPRARMLADADVDGEAEQALEIIAGLRSWYDSRNRTMAHQLTLDDKRAYVEAARALRRLDPESVKAAYAAGLARAEAEGMMPGIAFGADLFLLNRILFDPPARIPVAEARYFTDMATPIDIRRRPIVDVDMLFPLVLDETGAIADINPASVPPLIVGPYDAVDAFEHLHATYGFRDPIRYTGEPLPSVAGPAAP